MTSWRKKTARNSLPLAVLVTFIWVSTVGAASQNSTTEYSPDPVWKQWSKIVSHEDGMIINHSSLFHPYYSDGFCRTAGVWVQYDHRAGRASDYRISPSHYVADTSERDCSDALAVERFFGIDEGIPSDVLRSTLDGFIQAVGAARERAQLKAGEQLISRKCLMNIKEAITSIRFYQDGHKIRTDDETSSVGINIEPVSAAPEDCRALSFELDYSGEAVEILDIHILVE